VYSKALGVSLKAFVSRVPSDDRIAACGGGSGI